MVPWDLRALGTKRVEIQEIWYQKLVEGQISTVKWKCWHLECKPFIRSKGKLLESTFFSRRLLCGARWFCISFEASSVIIQVKATEKYFVAVSLYVVALNIVALCLNSVVEILKCQRSFKRKPLCKYFPTILFNMLCALKWILLSITSLCYLISRSKSVSEIFKCDLSDVSFVLAFSCGTVSCKGLHRILRLTGRVHRHSGRVSIPYRLRYRSTCRPTIGNVSLSTSTDDVGGRHV